MIVTTRVEEVLREIGVVMVFCLFGGCLFLLGYDYYIRDLVMANCVLFKARCTRGKDEVWGIEVECRKWHVLLGHSFLKKAVENEGWTCFGRVFFRL